MKMKLVFIILSVFTIVNTMPTETEDSSMMGGSFNEKTPLGMVISTVGKKLLSNSKKVIAYMMKGNCIKCEWNEAQKKILQDCIVAEAKNTIPRIAKKENKNFEHEDLVDFHKRGLKCMSAGFGLPLSETEGIDYEQYKVIADKQVSESLKDPLDRELIKSIHDTCSFHFTSGTNSVQQMLNFKKCEMNELMTRCKKDGKNPGMIVKLVTLFESLVSEPKCDGTIPEDYMGGYFKQCLDEQNAQWTANGLPPKLALHSSLSKVESMKLVMEFLMNYGKEILVKAFTCSMEKTKMLTSTPDGQFSVDLEAVRNIFDNIITWNNDTEKALVLDLFDTCKPDRTDKDYTEMTNMIEYFAEDQEMEKILMCKRILMERMKYDKCFVPKFLPACGLNNVYSRFMNPFLNYQVMNEITRDFLGKGGFIAGMHLMGLLGSKFEDVMA